MEIPFITSVTLVWLIYTYLFTDADRQIIDLFNRLKFSLSVNNSGVIEKTQLDVKMYLGIPEVIGMGEVFRKYNKNDPHGENIKVFENVVGNIDLAKKILIVNLFLLTIHPLFNCFFSTEAHIILSLIIGFIFYWYIQKLPKLEFSKIVPVEKSK